MMSNRNTLSGNYAGKNSRQNNFLSTIENLANQNINLGNFGDFHMHFYLNTFRRAHDYPVEQESEPEAHRYLYSIGKDPYRPNPTSTRISNPRHCCVRHFHETSCFEEHLDGCIKRYPNVKTHKFIMEMLDSKSVQALMSWKSSLGSSMLLHLHGEKKERAHWTTHFTLEMIGCIAQSDHAIGVLQTSAVLVHFCAQQANPSQWTQKDLLLDFLAQIRRSRLPELEVAHKCETYGQDSAIFHNVAESPAQLWALLRCAVTTANIESLYVFIDNLDCIQENAQPNTLLDLISKLDQFIEDCQQAKVTVRLVITSRSDDINITRHFPVSSRIALTNTFDKRSRYEIA